MIFVIVDQEYGDLDQSDSDFGDIWKLFQSDFPKKVREENWDSLAAAQLNYPSKTVMLQSDYQTIKAALNIQYEDEIALLELKCREVSLRDDVI